MSISLSPPNMKVPSFSIFQDKHCSIGKKGENIAAMYLKKKGFKILEMNYVNPKGKRLGEIDIIVRKEDILVFVEVKTRRGEADKVFPEDNLTPNKLKKLEKIATHYLQSHHLQNMPYHFDAITVLFNEKQIAVMRHFEHIFV